MKRILRNIFSILNKVLLLRYWSRARVLYNRYFLVSLKLAKGNNLRVTTCEFVKASITILGQGNEIVSSDSAIVRSRVLIEGKNNRLIVGQHVELRNVFIVIRGEHNSIEIGKNTKFNGGRMVNEGKNNSIQIGEDCLISDQVEIWASDTHKILDRHGHIINREKPIIIGNKVWVGCRASILKGVTIKDGSIIGMGTLVTNDVGEREVSIGIPNKTIKNEISWEE